MNKFITLLVMIFMHITDDFYLQGLLANMKQKSWWKIHASDNLYKYDYMAALLCHAFSWSFMVHAPIFILYTFGLLKLNFITTFLLFISTIIIHAYIDDLKANKKKINLIIDQSCHLIQVLALWIIYTF